MSRTGFVVPGEQGYRAAVHVQENSCLQLLPTPPPPPPLTAMSTLTPSPAGISAWLPWRFTARRPRLTACSEAAAEQDTVWGGGVEVEVDSGFL